ncbi:MAG TPA: hypothetical protein DDW73_15550 [Rhizobium sp.]|jgi:hypothetical protein|nr:hypothetical protein [Rhizobium sp.]
MFVIIISSGGQTAETQVFQFDQFPAKRRTHMLQSLPYPGSSVLFDGLATKSMCIAAHFFDMLYCYYEEILLSFHD